MVPVRKVLLYLLSPSQEPPRAGLGRGRRRAGRAVAAGGVVWR
jgi:hypothetical protein